MRWIGWVIVALVLAAMIFARLTDDKPRVGRERHKGSIAREAPGSDTAPDRDVHAAPRRATAPETL